MPAFKTSVARISAGLAASTFLASASFAATLVVNQESPLDISGDPGFTYIVNGGSGSLSVATDGFLLCANIGTAPVQPVTVIPQHGTWRLPVAQDVRAVGYNSGQLGVNKSLPSQATLVCHAVGAEGETRSPLTEGIFRNSYESKTTEQFSNLINWIPGPGFDWGNPNWSAVPTDPCTPTIDQPAAVDEDVTCAAVSGQRPAGAGATTRAPTIWTGTDGVSFFYVVRVDARYGPPSVVPAAPTLPIGGDLPEGGGGAQLMIVDGYDRGVVGVGGGYLGDGGTWCFLPEMPTALSGNMCVGSPFSDTLNGPVSYSVALSVATSLHVSFYMAFIRPIVGPPPAVSEPAVAVSILVEPSVVAEGGDKFKGDDIAFGFLPASQGFPWMSGGQ